jgi:hypothetical protein
VKLGMERHELLKLLGHGLIFGKEREERLLVLLGLDAVRDATEEVALVIGENVSLAPAFHDAAPESFRSMHAMSAMRIRRKACDRAAGFMPC